MRPRPQAPHSPLPSGITRTVSLRARFDSHWRRCSRTRQKRNNRLSRLGQAALIVFCLIPVVPIGWASDGHSMGGGIDLVAKQTVMLNPKYVDVADIPEDVVFPRMGEFPPIEKRRSICGFSWSTWWEAIIAGLGNTDRLVKNGLAGWFGDARFNVYFFHNSNASSVIFQRNRTNGFCSRDTRLDGTKENYSALHISDSALIASDSEPSNNYQTSGEINEGNISDFGFLAEAEHIKVFQIAGIGTLIGLTGIALFQWEGVLSTLGCFLMIC